MLTGDTVLGRGTTVVVHPDGELGAYLDSLDRLHALAPRARVGRVWPGHGPVHRDALGVLDYYVAHRARTARPGRGARSRSCGAPAGVADAMTLPRQVVEVVYADVDPVLWGAAELSVRAQLAYLASRSRVVRSESRASEPLERLCRAVRPWTPPTAAGPRDADADEHETATGRRP